MVKFPGVLCAGVAALTMALPALACPAKIGATLSLTGSYATFGPPISNAAALAVEHMNADHAAACLDMVRWLAGVHDATAARVHSIDRHGLTFYADRPDGAPLATARIAFPDAPLASADAVRGAVVVLARRARALADGAS